MSLSFGKPHIHHERTDSTNERARELAIAGAATGTVVTASEQTGGPRPRQGRVWSAPPDAALLYSAILRPLDLSHLLLPLAVPLAVCEACESLAPVACRIKWPNDIWLDEQQARRRPDRGEAARVGRDRGRGQRLDRASSRTICAGRRPRSATA